MALLQVETCSIMQFSFLYEYRCDYIVLYCIVSQRDVNLKLLQPLFLT